MLENPKPTIVLGRKGLEIGRIISYSLQTHFLSYNDELTVELAPDILGIVEDTWGPQQIDFYLYGKLQFQGIIDTQNVENDGSVILSARSFLSNIDTGMVNNVAIKKGETLDKAILRALGVFGITKIETDWTSVRTLRSGNPNLKPSSTPDPIATTSIVSDNKSQPSEGGMEFVKRIISRHGLLALCGSSRGSIALVSPCYTQPVAYNINRLNGGGPIILGRIIRDWSNIPTIAIAYGRTVASGEKGQNLCKVYPMFSADSKLKASSSIPEINAIVQGLSYYASTLNNPVMKQFMDASKMDTLLENQCIYYDEIKHSDPPKNDNDGTLYRPFIYKDNESKNQEEFETKLNREIANRVKDYCIAEYTIASHKDPTTGTIYTTDTLVNIVDNIGAIKDQTFWVESVSHNYNPSQGQTSTITCYHPDTIIL